MNWKAFLESQPPNQMTEIFGLSDGTPPYIIAKPNLELFCESESCAGDRFFTCNSSPPQISAENAKTWIPMFLAYSCRNCSSSNKLFAVTISITEQSKNGKAIKLGEWPPFGPRIPTKMIKLLGDDQEIFMKGRRAESQGMGIGAFSYYRRVVENQKNRLIDEIIRVCNRIKAPPELIATLTIAKNETQFSKAVEIIKDGVPEILRIDNHNPLSLLHSALSEGLHSQSDEECLELAISIRVVLGEFSERVAEALKNHAELNQAVTKLLQVQAKSNARKDIRDVKEMPAVDAK